MYGTKQWFFFEPAHARYERRHIHEWVRAEWVPGSEHAHLAHVCIQRAGDIIYVPHMWAHGVLNLAENTGYAEELLFVKSPLGAHITAGRALLDYAEQFYAQS